MLPLFLSFLFIQYLFTTINLDAKNNYYVENKMPLFFLVVALVGCAISIALSFSLKKYEKMRFLRVVGYNSVHIYCLQIIVMSVARQFYMNVLHIKHVPTLALLILASGVILPMIFYNLCLRINAWWLFTLKKPTDEIEYLQSKSN